MRFLIAPDKFKGSLSAEEAAGAIRAGFQRVFPAAEYELAPIADGGEGTAAAFHRTLGGEWIFHPAEDARGRRIEAEFLWLPERRTAVIDMSAASGLARLAEAGRRPWTASTRGTGQLLAEALRRGARTVYLGLGGSATNDAGAGLAAALGWTFRDAEGRAVHPIPQNFRAIRSIHPPASPISAEVIGMTDVANPLLGPAGCSAVFAPQKGARGEEIPEWDAVLRHLSDLVENGARLRELPGAGAAGGLGFGVLAFLGGRLEPGFAVVARLLDLATRAAAADWILTGEGKLDAQTLGGKGPAGVAGLARAAGKPVIAFAGAVDDAIQPGIFTQIVSLTDGQISAAESMARAAELLTAAAERTARSLRAK
ncbi:MAG TPA: glycerate kinase [Chthoniobacterales bacterium]